jgi:predicted secreted protein
LLPAGAALSCIDAPLKLQEPWVKQMLSQVNDRIFEQQMKSYNPLNDLQANDRLMPAAAAAWDAQLAAAARQLDLQHQQQQQRQKPGMVQQREAPPVQMAPGALALYKASRAAGAAMLLPNATPDVIERLQRLQPLKWAHFTQRQNFMAQQIKEAAVSAAAQRRKLAAAAALPSRDPLAGQPTQAAAAAAAAGGDKVRPVTLVAVVGRQHVHALQQMWTDKGSRLWRERVPRTFAPSVVERLAEQQEGSSSGQHQEAVSQPSSAAGGDSSSNNTTPRVGDGL